MAFTCVLPLGNLPAGATTSPAAHYSALRQNLAIDATPFDGVHVHQRYSLAATASAAMRRISAVWTGAPLLTTDQMVIVEMLPSQRLALGELLDHDMPVPLRATYGPIIADGSAGGVVQAGDTLGALAGNHFAIAIQDQDGYYLHPLAVFELFDRLRLWQETGGQRCPLLPATVPAHPREIEIAGATPAPAGAPYLRLAGGSLGMTVHNPPDPLPARYFSFLSSDTITISVAGAADGSTVTVRDVSDPMYRSRVADPPQITTALDPAHAFVPQATLRPFHRPYDSVNGKRTPGALLTYRISAVVAGAPPLATAVSQDARDVIRQEYVFHGPPFQGNVSALTIPTRAQVQHARRPAFARHFGAGEFARGSNYPAFLLNAEETFHVAEYLRRQYAEQVATRRAAEPDSIPTSAISFGLSPGSTWRNPERNEAVRGVRRSNHQTGYAVDLSPVHRRASGGHHPVLITALFDAARDFLEELIANNAVDDFGDVEIFLEQGVKVLWKYEARDDGTIASLPGGSYQEILQQAPPADPAVGIARAAPHASHVHVAWLPADPDRPLELPPVASYDPLPPTPETYRNVILIATEDDSVPDDERLPLNHIADSLKDYLQTIDPLIPTEIREVRNAFEWLQYCNAFRDPGFKIDYFFSLSHAWPGGLILEHFKGVPYFSDDGEPQIHDDVVLAQLSELYDPLAFDGHSDDFDFTDDFLLPVGEDDMMTVRTHQIRLSNLRWLPEEAKERMRRTFANARGVYILGCRAAQDEDVEYPPFCEELANLLHRPVRGAAYYSKVFTPSDDGEWQERTLTRSDPRPDDQPVVLVPGSYGTFQLLGYVWEHAAVPNVPDFPVTSSLLDVYDQFLTRCDPREPE